MTNRLTGRTAGWAWAIAAMSVVWVWIGAAPAAADAPPVSAEDVWEPVVLGPGTAGVLLLPNGDLKSFFSEAGDIETLSVTNKVYSKVSSDGGMTWGEPEFELEVPGAAGWPLLDKDGEYHLFPMAARGQGSIAIDYFIDIWHVKTRNKGAEWEEPKVIFEGYCGSINGLAQLSTGRIVLPFAEWIGGVPEGPPVGANLSTVVYSDDGGDTWHKSPSQLSAPCYTDFNGSGYGACEPAIIELKDGRVWMLVRTETGLLYESYSPDGVNWDPLRPSRFYSSDAPVGFVRLPDSRIMVFWNHCEKPPRVDGAGVYGARDALHAAISSDEGKTWYGFREVYRDPTRNQTPPRRGDRGTAYPFPYLAKYGKVIFISGQSEGLRNMIMMDPDWLLETSHKDDFSNGLDGWSVFKAFGPAQGWWRDRVQGATLAPHPEKEGSRVLHVRRPDEEDGDGANWNFPIGRQGDLTTRIRLQKGFGGAVIALMDRFFDPQDTNGEVHAQFVLPIKPDGRISLQNKIEVDTWHTLRFQWDLDGRTCVVSVDGEPKVYLPPSYTPARGVSYIRFRSTAEDVDTAGMLIESVEVTVGG